MNGRLIRLPAVLDREVDNKQNDAFGHQQFAEALASLLTDPSNVPPFSVGLLGRWGTGKSTIKALATRAIEDNNQLNVRHKILTFNAWRYGNEDIKRAFLRDVFQQLGGDEEALDRALKESTSTPTELRRPWQNVLKDVGDKIVTTLVTILFFFAVWWLINSQLPDSPTKAAVGTSLLAAFLSAGVIGGLLKDLYSNRWLTITKTIPPKKDAEDYEVLLRGRMEAFHKEYGKCERLIIFVDDLDRLSAEEMVQGLDAIRTFMEMRTRHLGVVFVISCDEAKIADALSNKRINKDLPAAAMKSQLDARRFLDRIFQYRLEIPPIPKLDMRDYALRKFKGELRPVAQAVEAAAAPTDQASVITRVIDRLIHVDVGTPRNALQLLNAFAQTWWLAQEREHIGINADARNALLPGTVTGRPEVLAATCVLRVDFPDFYSQLQDEPALIAAFGQVYRRRVDPDTLEVNDGARRIVQSYGRRFAEEDATSWVTDPAHASLARFLASIDDITWPTTLQPFLLLSQDPLSRELGDRAQAVMNSLTSGDLQGTLRELGHQSRTDALSARSTRFILDLRDEIQQLDTLRRERALEVLAQLPFTPDAQTQPLAIMLAQGLTASAKLRERVGLQRVAHLLGEVRREDRQGLSTALAKDYFSDRTAATLVEARTRASILMPALLNLKRGGDLSPSADTLLLNWFDDPKYLSATEDDPVPFSTMETWYAEHESDLLPTLDATYIQHILDAAGDDDFPDEEAEEKDPILQRLRGALNRRLDTPAERHDAWKQLEQLLGKDYSLAEVAWDITEEQHDDLTNDEFSSFIEAFAHVLTVNEDGGAILANQDADAAFLDLLERERSRLASVGIPAGTMELGLSWNNATDAASAARLLDILLAADHDRGQESRTTKGLLDDWIAELGGDLQEPIAHLILERLPDLRRASHRTAAFQRLLTLLKTSQTPAAPEAAKFRELLAHVNEDALANEEGKEFSEQATSWATSMAGNAEWITTMLPAVLRLYPHAGGDGGAMLAALNQQAAAYRTTMVPFHAVMADRWPPAGQGAPDYDPAAIFESAKTYMASYHNQPGATKVLHSMLSMRSTGATVKDADLSDAAFKLWPHDLIGASEVIRELNIQFNENRPITLLSNLPADNEPGMEAVIGSLRHVVNHMTAETRLKATVLLLNRPVATAGTMKDAELQLWLDALASQADATVSAALDDESMNEASLLRLWGTMLGQPGNFQGSTFARLVELTATKGWERGLDAVVDAGSHLQRTLGSSTELSQSLLELFLNETSDTRKKRIAEIMRFIVPDRFIRSNKVDERLSESDRTILEGTGHALKRRRN